MMAADAGRTMRWLLSLLAAALLIAAPARAGERISVDGLGFAITAPDHWQRVPVDQALAHLREVRVDNDELQRQLSQTRAPIVALRKYPLTHEGPIPILNVGFRAAGSLAGETPIQILEHTVRVARRAFPDLEVLEAPSAVTISGFPGAHLRVVFTQTQRDMPWRNISDYWVVPRGDYYFFVSTGYSPDEPAITREEILAAVASIVIEPLVQIRR
jgi:hypothetical protein